MFLKGINRRSQPVAAISSASFSQGLSHSMFLSAGIATKKEKIDLSAGA
jgi:hypothetical protein